VKPTRVVLGVTGSIAAYKALELVRRLKEAGLEVTVVMTDSARALATPRSFETLSGNRVYFDMFARRDIRRADGRLEHIDLARSADLLLVAPATANIIGKVASGIADDLLSTVIMATSAPVIFAPAMNDRMWLNRVVQANVARLKELGYGFVTPGTGALACGTQGQGRLAEIDDIVGAVRTAFAGKGPLAGRRVLITLGRTEEEIDPVRVVTNRSSGRLGIELARAAQQAGAEVKLICGKTSVPVPSGFDVEHVTSTAEMQQAVHRALPGADVLLMAAAPADYRPRAPAADKCKEPTLTLELERTPDILTSLKSVRHHARCVGFSLERQDLVRRARQKLQAKNLDMIVANPVATLDGPDIEAVLVSRSGRTQRLGRLSKREFAARLIREVAGLPGRRRKQE
jgi:phosphopantothenoylcysteine decarboxylase/phosphopantothenate--cysteine ligase